ncbi:MAG: SDR family oxidoreductase [Balneolales bacterium]
MDFHNKTVWITGASSGLGEAMAYAWSRQGAKLILSSRKRDELERVKKQCQALGGEAAVEPLDLSQPEALQDIAAQVLKSHGPVDYLVNNGGVAQRSSAVDTRLEIEQAIMQINFMGAVALTKAVLPDMIERKSGHIVVISSVMGKFAAPNCSTYVASKHALQGYFDTVRSEVDRFGVNVTLVCPGFVRTNVSVNAFKADGTPHRKMDRGQRRGMAPEVCARKILKAVYRRREEITIGGPEIAGVYLKRWFPWLVSRIIRRITRPGARDARVS